MSNISKSTFTFLKDLKKNNDRDWFQANKPRYQEALGEFEKFIDGLIAEVGKFDPSISHHTAKGTIFRIYRDVRFSKDKSPYKTHFGAHITAAAKRSEIHSRAGYYIHLEPGGTFMAGGAYLPEKDWLAAIRQEIDYNADSFKKILNNKKFKDTFGELEGEKLKTAPRDYPKDHPEIELLKQKSFLVSHSCSDSEVTSADFLKHAAGVFKTMKPCDDVLNEAKN